MLVHVSWYYIQYRGRGADFNVGYLMSRAVPATDFSYTNQAAYSNVCDANRTPN
jgi:hypothetical protein